MAYTSRQNTTKYYYVASDDVVASRVDEESTTASGYTKVMELTLRNEINQNSGFRFKWD